MKKVIVVLVLFIPLQLFAQSKSAQVSIGLNQSWFIYKEAFLNDYKPDFKPKMNLSFNYNFAEFGSFTTSAGIRYYNLSRSVTYDDGNSNKVNVKNDHYLVSLPLQLKYKLSFINTYLILNAETSYILSSNIVFPSPINADMTERTTTDEMHRILFTIGVGAEYVFTINDETFSVKSIYNYGLTKIPKADIFKLSDGTIYSWASYGATELSVSLSYYL